MTSGHGYPYKTSSYSFRSLQYFCKLSNARTYIRFLYWMYMYLFIWDCQERKFIYGSEFVSTASKSRKEVGIPDINPFELTLASVKESHQKTINSETINKKVEIYKKHLERKYS